MPHPPKGACARVGARGVCGGSQTGGYGVNRQFCRHLSRRPREESRRGACAAHPLQIPRAAAVPPKPAMPSRAASPGGSLKLWTLLAPAGWRRGAEPVHQTEDSRARLDGVAAGRFMPTFLRKLRLGVRLLLKAPAFTAVALLVLALSFGANTAMFSIADSVQLRPLPYPDPGGLRAARRWAPAGAGWLRRDGSAGTVAPFLGEPDGPGGPGSHCRGDAGDRVPGELPAGPASCPHRPDGDSARRLAAPAVRLVQPGFKGVQEGVDLVTLPLEVCPLEHQPAFSISPEACRIRIDEELVRTFSFGQHR